jgi:exopolyphosphatase/guanosine-5'-triphosphate,3'-diphosphate pyrophosphatase
LKNNILIKKVATIDIGSNAIRLLISNVIRLDGKLHHTKNSLHRVPVRLGQDSFLNNKIADSSKDKLINTIRSFKFLMKANEIDDYLAYATSAMRNASNGQEILDNIFEETKIKIEIISGKKESEIVASNDITEHIGNSPNYCFIDVGGGSTEVIIYKNHKLHKSKSFKIGGVRLLNDLVEEKSWDEFKFWLLENALEIKKIKLVGIGGNINKIFKLSGNKYGKPLSRSKFKSTLKKLNKTSTKKMLIDLKLNPDRIDVILPAGKIYYFLMKTLSIEKIFVPKIGLADGMVKRIINSKIKL